MSHFHDYQNCSTPFASYRQAPDPGWFERFIHATHRRRPCYYPDIPIQQQPPQQMVVKGIRQGGDGGAKLAMVVQALPAVLGIGAKLLGDTPAGPYVKAAAEAVGGGASEGEDGQDGGDAN